MQANAIINLSENKDNRLFQKKVSNLETALVDLLKEFHLKRLPDRSDVPSLEYMNNWIPTFRTE